MPVTLAINFVGSETVWTQTLVIFALEGPVLAPKSAALDAKAGGVIQRALTAAGAKGKRDEITEILAPNGVSADRVLVLGLGAPDKLDEGGLESAGAALAAKLTRANEGPAAVLVDVPAGFGLSEAEMAARLALGARLRAYRFDKYRTTMKDDEKPNGHPLTLISTSAAAAQSAFSALEPLAEGVFFARDLASEPANILFPVEMAARAQALTDLGVKVTVLGEAEMADLGMGALLGVGQGSVRESQLIVLEWYGAADKSAPPVALVGKGVCFDTGGISLKPPGDMWDMKWDMGGAAAVLGAFRALAGRKARANVIGVIAAVENMPDGNAQRPGDVVTSMSGQTIEVLNTDAEGRLILADAVWYAEEKFKPRAMIDLATLTGAIIIALGSDYAGLFANDETLASDLLAASKSAREPLWRMPLGESFDKRIKSPIADIQNISNGREAGASIGAAFIGKFVRKAPWAHLDIAGVTWSKEAKDVTPKGAVGFGVRLLDRYVAQTAEDQA
jgi:leucyl aminopeptidase